MPESKVGGEGIDESVKVHTAEVGKTLLESGSKGGGIVAAVCRCLGVPWRHAQEKLGQVKKQALCALASG